MSSGFSEKQGVFFVLFSVAGSQNLLQVDLIIVLYLLHAYPDILENGEKISVFKHIRIQVDTA